LYVFVDDILMPLITRHNTEFELQDITGYVTEDAEQVLDMADLKMEITAEEYHPDKKEGTILSQYPPAFTKVKSGRIVKVIVSSGQKMVTVPKLAGFSVRQAKLNIEAAGLELGDIVWTFADSLPEKVIVFSYPASGTEIPFGAPVNLMVNRGSLANVVYMPQLVGLSLEEARAVLDEKGLRVGLITHVRDENYLPETVLEQSVEEATELEIEEEIDLIVSTTE
jgi:serine/threonine-protein kinase